MLSDGAAESIEALWVVQAFLAEPAAAVLAFLFGALWGSFFNVCIARIPLGKSVVRPASHCFACQAKVRPWHNVPIVSYLLLRGRCASCGVRFSARYLLIEIFTGLVSLALFWVFARDTDLPLALRLSRYVVGFAFAGVLIVLSFIDLDTKRLPDIITLPSIPVFFLAGFGTQLAPWLDRAIGAVGGYLAVRLISDGYYYLRGREGLGLGDAKLLAVVGALLGWKALPPVIFSASLLGIVVAVPALVLARRSRSAAPTAAPVPTAPAGAQDGEQGGEADGEQDGEGDSDSVRFTQIPFGPFLALSSFGYLLLAERLGPWLLAYLAG